MSATPAPAAFDRSDFRTVTVGGATIGLITSAAVVAFVLVSRHVAAAVPRQLLELLIVLAGGVAAAFLPARWTVARSAEGIAGAAALGFVGTVVFTAIDIALLRPLRAYPWTWDAIGGNSTWWYLPIWWMLGTLLAWTGSIVTAGQAARGEAALVRTASPTVAGAIVLATVTRAAGLHVAVPVAAGGGLTLMLAVLAVVALARKP